MHIVVVMGFSTYHVVEKSGFQENPGLVEKTLQDPATDNKIRHHDPTGVSKIYAIRGHG